MAALSNPTCQHMAQSTGSFRSGTAVRPDCSLIPDRCIAQDFAGDSVGAGAVWDAAGQFELVAAFAPALKEEFLGQEEREDAVEGDLVL